MAREARQNPKKARATRVEGPKGCQQPPDSAFCLTCIKCYDYFLFRNFVSVNFVTDYFLVCIVTDHSAHSPYRGSS
jgi:hypothetical protein